MKNIVAIKLFTYYVFQPKALFSSWQEQIIFDRLSAAGWQSKADFWHIENCEFADNF